MSTAQLEVVPTVSPADFLPPKGGQMVFQWFSLTDNGLIVHPDTTVDEWLELVRAASIAFKSTRETHIVVMFRFGDLLVHGEDNYPGHSQACSDALAEIMSESTKARAEWVARKVAKEIRREDLSFEHHEVVAKLDPSEQRKLLNKAAAEHMTTKELKEEVKILHPSSPRAKKKKAATSDKITEAQALTGGQVLLDYLETAEQEHGNPRKWANIGNFNELLTALFKFARRSVISSHKAK